MKLKIIACDVPKCNEAQTETEPEVGWPGWGQLQGIVLNDIANPCLCPKHLNEVADFVDNLEG